MVKLQTQIWLTVFVRFSHDWYNMTNFIVIINLIQIITTLVVIMTIMIILVVIMIMIIILVVIIMILIILVVIIIIIIILVINIIILVLNFSSPDAVSGAQIVHRSATGGATVYILHICHNHHNRWLCKKISQV